MRMRSTRPVAPSSSHGRRPTDLFEIGLSHLDEANRVADQASPNFTKANMHADLATAHFLAARLGLALARMHWEALEGHQAHRDSESNADAGPAAEAAR